MNKKELTSEPEQRIFITNTMRSGSSLVISALCAHPRILILSDNIHFFRFMHKRFQPLNEKNLYRLLLYQKARLYYRTGIEMDTDTIFENIERKEISYRVIYDEIMMYFMKSTSRTIWGEAPALQWREIPAFLRFFPGGKVIHIYRDPRGVLASWKKLSSLPDNVYLNAIFNWIDSLNYLERYKESLPPENYLPVKFEDVMENPEKWMRILCDFSGVPFDEILVQPERWEGAISGIGNNLVKVPRSAHEGNNITGFSVQRTQNWTKELEEWEIALVEFFAKEKFEKFGFDLHKDNYHTSIIKKGLDIIRENPFLLKQLQVYLATGEGTNKYPSDPTDPGSWGAPHNPSEWFLDSPVARDYFRDIKLAEEISKKI
tara:strand:+ start:81 stop:1202 length:1122 start_codon:yes stop_codon:yes gene_type:complete